MHPLTPSPAHPFTVLLGYSSILPRPVAADDQLLDLAALAAIAVDLAAGPDDRGADGVRGIQLARQRRRGVAEHPIHAAPHERVEQLGQAALVVGAEGLAGIMGE